jgi:hypothetical protein
LIQEFFENSIKWLGSHVGFAKGALAFSLVKPLFNAFFTKHMVTLIALLRVKHQLSAYIARKIFRTFTISIDTLTN